MKSHYLIGASAAALWLGAAGGVCAQTSPEATPTAQAETVADASDQQATNLDEIVVTGSFIAGTPKTTAIPVTVVGQEEISRRGTPNVVELIKTLPISGPTLGDSNQFAAGANARSGAGSINIRGLGPQRTLVLLNGQRFAGYVADTNLLPISAIGRVEILKDGAAATYGSDAISGVVNFITRRNFDGFELAGDYRYVDGSDGDYTASAAYGVVGDTSNLLLTFGYQHRSELSNTERDSVLQPYTENPSGYSLLNNPGVWTIRNGPAGSGASLGTTVDANCAEVGGTPGFSGLQPVCYYYYVPMSSLVDETDYYQAYGEFNADLGASTRFHVEALYSATNSTQRLAAGYPPTQGPNGPGGTNAFYVPSSNPGFNTFLQQTGNGALIGTAQSATATFWRPLASGGNPTVGGRGGNIGDRNYDLFRISSNLKGDTGFWGIGYSLTASYIREGTDSQTPDVLIDRLQRALNGLGGPNCTGTTPGANNCQYFNPFSNAFPNNPAFDLTNPGYVSANANSPELVGWMFDRAAFQSTQQTVVVDAVFNGTLPWSLPGGEIGWAGGAQFRKIYYGQQPKSPFYDARITPCPVVGVTTCQFPTGPFFFQGQNIALDLDQQVFAAFTEFNLPVTDALNVQVSGRYEDYGGGTGSTFNPQLRAKFEVNDVFSLRGSVGTSFRGPTAQNVAPTGSTTTLSIAAAGNGFKPVDSFGNPDTKPETAVTYSVGGILQLGGLTATLDYWHYKLKDQITTVAANTVGTAVGGVGNGTQFVNCSSPVRNLVTFSNGNTCTQGVTVGNDISRVRLDTTNGPTIETSGLDLDVSYSFGDVMGGDLNIGGTGSYVFNYEQDAFAFAGVTVSPAYDAAGYTNYDRLPGTISHLRGNLFVNYNRGPQNLRWTMNYVGGADDNRGPTTVQTGPSTNCNVVNANAGTATNCKLITFGAEVDAFVTHDLTYQVELPHDLTFTATVFNLLDEAPPQARLELSYDPFIGSPIGRTFKIGLRKTF